VLKKAIITGINGQDGAYLANFLLNKNYKVYGFYRRNSSNDFWRLKYFDILDKVTVIDLDITEQLEVHYYLNEIKPDEIYNLAAQSFVQSSFNNPYQTTVINSLAVLFFLETIKTLKLDTSFYQASTSEMFGNINSTKQNEKSGFNPRSPYGVSKLYSHNMCLNYREAFNMETYSGILFNHESPLRGYEFVTRKITNFLASYYTNRNDKLHLGNLYAKRDWGFAGEYVEVMWEMINKKKDFDYVVGTGTTTTIKKFIEFCLNYLEINYQWTGEGVKEKCIDKKTGKAFIEISKEHYRPTEVNYLKADITKLKKDLKWEPKIKVQKLAVMMMKSDLLRNK